MLGRIYGETIDSRIRTGILLMALGVCFFCCQKEDEPQPCKTCTVTTTFDPAQSGQPTQTYIESQTEYCNGEADTIKQGEIYYRKTSTDGGATWTIESKERICQ